MLEVDIPGILERRKHRTIGLDRPGELIEHYDAPIVTDERGDIVPQL